MKYATYIRINQLTYTSMNTPALMEERLWDYIDGLSSPAERSAIDILIAENKEWQDKYKELLHTHELLNSSELEAPSMRFTKNVMEEIGRYHVAPATRSYINKNVIRGIGAFFLSMITGLIVFMLTQFKWTSSPSNTNTTNLPKINLDGLNKLNKIDYAKTFNTNYLMGFMLIAIIAGWMLLDMYLQQKKKQVN